MDQVILLEHLKDIERNVAHGLAQITRQHSRIADLDSGGHDSRKARAVLGMLLETQTLHEETRLRLLGKLAHNKIV